MKNEKCGLVEIAGSGPDADHLFADIAPPLDGIADKFTEGELRLRLVDPKAINPDTVMPAYYRWEGLNRVLETYAGRPIYTAQQVEDVVAYLMTLREKP
jgi:sulfur-oxidizing protein SoxX